MMKKIIPVLSIVVLIWGCAKKMTPAKSETPVSNNTATNSSTTPTTTVTTTASTNTTTTGAVPGPTTASSNTKPLARPGEGNDAAAIAGQATFNAKCGRCHGLKVVSNYTWERWISIMQVMAMKANLDATEKENVLAYVKANSKK